MKKSEIEEILYENESELEDLLKLYTYMKEYDFSSSDYEYLNTQIDESLDDIDDLESVRFLFKKYNYSEEVLDHKISIVNALKLYKIEDMNKEQIEYIYYNEELNLVDHCRLYTMMKKYNFDVSDLKDEIDNIVETMNYMHEEIGDPSKEMFKLFECKKEASKYNAEVSFILKRIKTISSSGYERHPSYLGNALLLPGKALLGVLGGISGMVDKPKKRNNDLTMEEEDLVKKGIYDTTSFDYEELEEDDYFYDDLD